MFWKTKNFKMFTDYTYARIFENYYTRMCFFLIKLKRTDFVFNAGIKWTAIREDLSTQKSHKASYEQIPQLFSAILNV